MPMSGKWAGEVHHLQNIETIDIVTYKKNDIKWSPIPNNCIQIPCNDRSELDERSLLYDFH